MVHDTNSVICDTNVTNRTNCASMANKKSEDSVSVNQNLPNKLLSCLYSQRRTGRLCDVVLNVGDVKFSVHSCVLASFSPYFNDIFMSTSEGTHAYEDKSSHVSESIQKDIPEHWSLRNPLHLNLPLLDSGYGRRKVVCSDCTAKVLDFMYLGKIQIQKEHVDHVKSISTVLEVSELLLICDKYNEKYASQKKRRPEILSKQPFPKKLKKDAVPTDNERCVNDVNNDEGKHNEEDVSGTQKGSETNDTRKNVDGSKSEPVVLTNQTSSVDEGVSAIVNTVNNEKVDCSVSNNTVDTFKSADDPYMCHICELKFSSSVLLRQHRETHRGRLHTCYACRYSSYKAFELIKHLLEADHQEIVCSLCLFEAETPEKLKDHLKQHNHPKPFFCSICNVRFQTRAALNTHTPKHSTEMPFSCSLCNRAFKWKQGLQNHMAVHTPEKRHLCSECGFSTAYQSTFRAHTLMHTSNMFVCPHAECNFKSARKQNFVSHLMTHNKEKPYQCEVCGQSYSQSKNLRRHAVKHDAVAEEFLEHCPLCLYQTMRLDKLKIHFKKHHPDGDEKLLNLQRRKHRMRTLKTVNHSDVNMSENMKQGPGAMSAADCVVKQSEPFSMETQQLQEVQLVNNRRENKPPEGNTVIVNGLQLLQEGTNGNATFIITGLNTRLPQIVTSRDVEETSLNNFQRDSLLFNEEGAVLLLDNLNTLFVPANEKCPLVPLSFNSVNNFHVPDVAVKQSNSVQIGNERPNLSATLKTISADNRAHQQQLFRTETPPVSRSMNPKLLHIDDMQNTPLDITNNENLLKSSKTCDSKLVSGDSFTLMFNSVNDSRIQQLTAIVDGFNRGEIPLGGADDSSALSATVGSLINEQLQALTNHKEDSTLDMLNNNMIRELFADDGAGTELDVLSKDVVQELVLNEDSTNTLDILSKDMSQVDGNEETLSVVLDNSNKNKVLLCHETITDDADNLQRASSEGSSELQVNEDCDNPVLQTFQSFESILESLSLPDKI